MNLKEAITRADVALQCARVCERGVHTCVHSGTIRGGREGKVRPIRILSSSHNTRLGAVKVL